MADIGVLEAEDVVQDAFVRMLRADTDVAELESSKAFAATVTTRIAIDTLRSARARRERYTGTWLPEPLVESSDLNPAWRIERDETMTIAFLTLLERLSPLERAVFVLREALGYSHSEIANVVQRSEAASRQLYSRATRTLADAGAPRGSGVGDNAKLAERFVRALRDGDVDGLERLLTADVMFSADGGGKAPAISKPLHGRTAVARFLLGLQRQAGQFGARMQLASANADAAFKLLAPNGDLLGVLALEIRDGEVAGFYNQISPDKLHHLGHVGDINALRSTTSKP
jgi:RNA polymerase sigma factor (sigma-70 family)